MPCVAAARLVIGWRSTDDERSARTRETETDHGSAAGPWGAAADRPDDRQCRVGNRAVVGVCVGCRADTSVSCWKNSSVCLISCRFLGLVPLRTSVVIIAISARGCRRTKRSSTTCRLCAATASSCTAVTRSLTLLLKVASPMKSVPA